MNSVIDFFSNKNIAVVGVSKKGTGFGYNAYQYLKTTGHSVFPVNISSDNIEGNVCYHNLNELAGRIDSVLIVVPPAESLKVVKDAVAVNIRNIWFQPGSESNEAVDYCRNNGLNVIERQCFFMYYEPMAGFHKFHRFFHKLAGKYAK